MVDEGTVVLGFASEVGRGRNSGLVYARRGLSRDRLRDRGSSTAESIVFSFKRVKPVKDVGEGNSLSINVNGLSRSRVGFRHGVVTIEIVLSVRIGIN